MTRRLIASGDNIDTPDRSGITPLHLACYRNDIDLAEELLACGAKPESMSRDFATPLKIAQIKKNDVLAQLIDKWKLK